MISIFNTTSIKRLLAIGLIYILVIGIYIPYIIYKYKPSTEYDTKEIEENIRNYFQKSKDNNFSTTHYFVAHPLLHYNTEYSITRNDFETSKIDNLKVNRYWSIQYGNFALVAIGFLAFFGIIEFVMWSRQTTKKASLDSDLNS